MDHKDIEPPDTDTPCDCPRCGRLLNSYACRCGHVDKRDADEAMQQAVKDGDAEEFADAFWALHGDRISADSRKAVEINPRDFARRAIREAAEQAFSLQ